MTMGMPANKTTVLAVIAAMASVGGPVCALAQANTVAGGASAPASGAAGSAKASAKVHPTGLATWFGPGFYGQKTACGQTLTPAVIGVANRALPCGTLVKVSYKGHSLTVPVLDRGPYSRIGADWDLTAGAAAALEITDTVRVHTAVVGSAPNTPTLGSPPVPVTALLAGGASAG